MDLHEALRHAHLGAPFGALGLHILVGPKDKAQLDPDTLTIGEQTCLDVTSNVATAFSRLPELHPSDLEDVVRHVHAIQNIILARAAFPAELRGE